MWLSVSQNTKEQLPLLSVTVVQLQHEPILQVCSMCQLLRQPAGIRTDTAPASSCSHGAGAGAGRCWCCSLWKSAQKNTIKWQTTNQHIQTTELPPNPWDHSNMTVQLFLQYSTTVLNGRLFAVWSCMLCWLHWMFTSRSTHICRAMASRVSAARLWQDNDEHVTAFILGRNNVRPSS